jgi:aminoglycoside phosphotransferase (APT) family kinase protein
MTGNRSNSVTLWCADRLLRAKTIGEITTKLPTLCKVGSVLVVASLSQYPLTHLVPQLPSALNTFPRDMAADAPCTACSWTTNRQNKCRYHSHIQLFYSMSDRGVWSVGSKYILKERSNKPPNFEAQNLQFLAANTTIPIPTVALDFNDDDDRYFMITKRISGDALNTVWDVLSTTEKENIAKQTTDYLSQLRQLQSPRMQSLGENPLYSTYLFLDGFGAPHGPLSSDNQLWAELAQVLNKLPKKACLWFRERMPSATPYTFTHGDLAAVNIIVKDGNLAGILDWESSGYFPVWWESTCTSIGLGADDAEWKALLRKYMPPHEAAREFWLDLYALRNYPELNERGEQALARLLRD